MAKVHHLRAIAQALVAKDERLELSPAFMEYGKLQVVDLSTNRTYLVRSSAAVAIEDARQPELISRGAVESPIVLVVYQFHSTGLDLLLAGTRQTLGQRRLAASGPAALVATWPYTMVAPPPPFNQGSEDPFGEVGDVTEDERGDVG